MSHLTATRSSYTAEYLNRDNIWKPVEVLFEVEGPIPTAQHPHEAWINTILRVMSYEAAVALIAVEKARSWEAAHCIKYRIRRWDVRYELTATETEDTAEFCDNLFSLRKKDAQ